MTTKNKIPLTTYRFSVEEYHRMGEAGIIPADCQVELINGEIVEQSPIKSPQAGTVNLLNRKLSELFGEKYIISVQNPITLDQFSEPEPDLAVLSYRSDLYTQSHPQPADVLLTVEVADTSLEKDQKIKIPLYAAAGIPEAWIVNLVEQQIEVYSQPSSQGYSMVRICRKGDPIKSSLIESLQVNDFLIN